MATQPKANPIKGIWSVYDADLKSIAVFDTFLDYDATQESKVVTMPVEKGSFAGYNKVASPYDVTVRLARSGPPETLAKFITDLERFANGTDLVSVVTPHKVYTNANIESFKHGMKRESGVSMLVAELSLVEIRQVSANYKRVKRAGHKKPQDRGLVQAQKPRVAVLEAANKGVKAWAGIK